MQDTEQSKYSSKGLIKQKRAHLQAEWLSPEKPKINTNEQNYQKQVIQKNSKGKIQITTEKAENKAGHDIRRHNTTSYNERTQTEGNTGYIYTGLTSREGIHR